MARHVSDDDLLAAVHDRLTPEHERWFWAHIVHCRPCSERLADYEGMRAVCTIVEVEMTADLMAMRARYWARIAQVEASGQRPSMPDPTDLLDDGSLLP